MALECVRAGGCLDIPDLDGTVVRCRCDQGRIGREGNRVDPVDMALERVSVGSRLDIPYLDSAISRCRYDQGRIGREGS